MCCRPHALISGWPQRFGVFHAGWSRTLPIRWESHGDDCHSGQNGRKQSTASFPLKEGLKQRPALPGPYCMDLLVAWEALSILLPMASTSFPIPLIVLQEERARAAASVKRADLIFISRREVESRILTCFRFLVNEPASSNLL